MMLFHPVRGKLFDKEEWIDLQPRRN